MRVVSAKKKCRKRVERRLTWNQTGPQGLQGPAGAVGSAGSAGATNVAIRFENFTSNGGGQSGHVDVDCNAGERAVGGGIGWIQSPGGGDAVLYTGPKDAGATTFPSQGAAPNGWAGEIVTSDGAGKMGRVYAICSSP